MKSIPVYRFRFTQCRQRLSWPKESYTGQAFEAGQPPYYGECFLHQGGNCRFVLINETSFYTGANLRRKGACGPPPLFFYTGFFPIPASGPT
jgi:hypothetical protein